MLGALGASLATPWARRLLVLGMVLVITVAGLLWAWSPRGQAGGSQPQARTDHTQQVATDKLADWFGPQFRLRSGGAFGAQRAQVLPAGPASASSLLQVRYPAGSASMRSAAEDSTTDGGTQLYLNLSAGPVDALHLRYCVRFPVGFDFVKGGKLPGLFGGWVTSGQHIPNGTNGWSTRLMWRTGGAGEVYAYLPTSVTHGTSLGRGSWHFTPGRWDCVEQAVVLNTPGRPDGSVTVWLDGHQVLQAGGLLFRTTPALRIDGLFFSTFFGGGDSTWASPSDQVADFADFAVSSAYIGPPSSPPSTP